MKAIIARLWALCTSLGGVAVESRVEEVLARVPDDAGLLVLAPDFGGFITALGSLGSQLDLAELKDLTPARALEDLFGPRMAGVDLNGPLAIALSRGADSPVLILSLADPEVWMRDGQPVEGSGELISVAVVGGGQWFTAVVGRIAVASDARGAAESALKAGGGFRRRFEVQGRAFLEGGYLGVLWVDVPAWKGVIAPAVDLAEGFVQMGLAMAAPQAEGTAALWRWFFQQCRQVVGQTRECVVGIVLGEEGVRFGGRATIEGEEGLARYLEKLRKSQRDLLRGLPDVPTAVAFGCEWFLPEGVESFGEAMLGAILATPGGQSLREEESVREGLEAARRVNRRIRGYSVVVPAGGPGIAAAGLYLCERGEEALKDLAASMELLASEKMMGTWGAPLGVRVTRRTERIGSVEAEAFDYVFTSDDPQMQEVLWAVYGESSTYRAAPHAEGIAFAFAAGDAARPLLEGLLAGSGGRLAQRADVAAARERISPDPQVLLLVDPVRSVEVMLASAKSAGAAIPPVKLPVGPPQYIVAGLYLERRLVKTEVFMPVRPIREILAALRGAAGPRGRSSGRVVAEGRVGVAGGKRACVISGGGAAGTRSRDPPWGV